MVSRKCRRKPLAAGPPLIELEQKLQEQGGRIPTLTCPATKRWVCSGKTSGEIVLHALFPSFGPDPELIAPEHFADRKGVSAELTAGILSIISRYRRQGGI
jgi:hypothetical protein